MIAGEENCGFPSMEKPWMKYYSEEAIAADLPKCTIYEYLYNKNEEHLNDVAVNYFGCKITYKKLFKNINKTAGAFLNIGVKQGDIVTIMLTNTPEMIYTVYALNMIGAIGNLMYLTATPKDVEREMLKTNSKVAVVLDSFYETYKDALKNADNIIIVSPWYSLPPVKKILYRIKVKQNLPSNLLRFNSMDSKSSAIETVGYKENITAIMLHSGGTTGIPKAVELTNENINSIAVQYSSNGMEYNRQESFMHTIPPFHAFGFSVGVHTPLCLGLELFASVKFDEDFLNKFFYDNKPNHFVSSATILKSILGNSNVDLSFLKNIAIGGTSLPPKDILATNEFLKSRNCSAVVATGYGMSELSATVCTERNDCTKIGSIGVPLPKVNAKVVSIDTGSELEYGQEGELCFSSPGIMKGYYQNAGGTNDIIEYDANGVKWLHTGDLGFIDNDGFVFITGRIKRLATTKDSGGSLFKLFPDYIEFAIKQLEIVEDCAVICVEHQEYKNVAIAFVVGDSSMENIIRTHCKNELPTYSQPYLINFVDKIPRTNIGKVDYRSLEKSYSK